MSVDLLLALGDARLQGRLVHPAHGHHVIVQHQRSPAGHRTDRQLLVAGEAELADHQHVQRGVEALGHLSGDDHAPARQAQHHEVIGAPEVGERIGQASPGVDSIAEPDRTHASIVLRLPAAEQQEPGPNVRHLISRSQS